MSQWLLWLRTGRSRLNPATPQAPHWMHSRQTRVWSPSLVQSGCCSLSWPRMLTAFRGYFFACHLPWGRCAAHHYTRPPLQGSAWEQRHPAGAAMCRERMVFQPGSRITRPTNAAAGRSRCSSTNPCSRAALRSLNGADFGPARSTCRSICSLAARASSNPARYRL